MQFRAKTIQEKGTEKCPAGCEPPLIIKAVPNLGSVANAFCRCMRCLTYWEVTPSGVIVNLKTGDGGHIHDVHVFPVSGLSEKHEGKIDA